MPTPTTPTSHEGGCLCGALRYRITAEPYFVTACHCTDCQRSTGSAFGMSMIMPRSGFQLLHGTPRVFTKKFEDDGRQKHNNFCSECGVRISTDLSKFPEIINVKPGTLDDTSWIEPVGHLWRRSAQSWVALAEGMICFDGQPTDPTPLLQAWAARKVSPKERG